MAPRDDGFVALHSPRQGRSSVGSTTVIKNSTNGNSASTVKPPPPSRGPTTHSQSADEDPNKPPVIPPISLYELYRFATPLDLVLLFVGCCFACVNGVLFPCMALVFGHAIAAFDPFDQQAVNAAAMEYLAIAIALFITDFLVYAMFGAMSERQIKLLREKALRHYLHMDISWYDTNSSHAASQLATSITADTVIIKNGMGQKLGDTIKFMGQFLAGYAIGFAQSWDMALVMSCVTPLTVASMSFLLSHLRTNAAHSQKVYAEASAIAEETLAAMRTVASLNGEQNAIAKYDLKTQKVEEASIQMYKKAGFVQGIFTCSLWLMYAVGLWYGGWKVYKDELAPSRVFQAFFGVVMGTWSLGQISPNVSAIAEARGAAASLFHDLDTNPEIDASRDDLGLCPEFCHGEIVLENVFFAYPSRLEMQVLRGLGVEIASGQTVAFVGPSGGGKSTIVSLLERFYDPQSGGLSLDGYDLKELNVKWLRAQIGLVSQEPVLFATSVFANIAAGSVGHTVTMEQVVEAAILANAHGFIMELPNQYDTFVGEKGVSLSGGQKQRIAIARAMVRHPKILILDEATSALDTQSERIVQEALTHLMHQRQRQMTTIVIAHRLSTIRSADKIVVMADGRVAEQGTHDQLVRLENGVYKSMLTMQAMEAAAQEPIDDAIGSGHGSGLALPLQRGPCSGDNGSTISSAIEPLPEVHGPQEEQEPESSSRFSLWDAMKLSAPESKYYGIGMAAAVVQGLSLPLSAVMISQVIALLSEKYAKYQISQDIHELETLSGDVQSFGVWYILCAGVVGAAHWVQVYCFRVMAAKLTSRLRHVHFLSMCRQDIAFFDDAKHSTGALTSDLAIHALKASLMSGDSQGRLVQAATTLVAAVLVAFLTGSWLLTLIMLLILPCILLGEVIRNKHMKGALLYTDELGEAGAQASQALGNVRTVMAFGLENFMCQQFSLTLDEPLRKGKQETKISGLAVGYSSFVVFATYALVFWYGGELVSRGEISFKELIRTLMAIIMASQGIGFAASWLGESTHAMKSGAAIFQVRDRPHVIDALREDDDANAQQLLHTVEGRIEFRDVCFRYPTRPTVAVLDGFNLIVGAKQTVGFCGTSGGGKSTIVALVERFYDPISGHVVLDGCDIKQLHVGWLRRQIGYVGQEPTLFIGTIAENIAYGLDLDAMPPQEEIERVAKLSNAHEFISNLPGGYATQVGARGELLSGGQKQRIAIARAILRKPRILILDEATSALDSTSERIVQSALDVVVASQKCTTLVIAHRLSTMRNADKICVIDHGRIVEEGSHTELVEMGGIYTKLLQSSEKEKAPV